MKEIFDPETVERFDLGEGFMDESPDGNYVEYSVYDKLLELYKEAKWMLDGLRK